MTWDTPTVEAIACGMDVTAYAPATESHETTGLPAQPTADAQAD